MVNNTLTSNNGEDRPYNVTEFSEAMWQSYFNATSYYVFDDGDANTIPLSYQIGNQEDPAAEVQIYYITDFKVLLDDLIYVGVADTESPAMFEDSQKFPYPPNGTTSVTVSQEQAATLSFEVFNMMGQKVFEIPSQHYGRVFSHSPSMLQTSQTVFIFILLLQAKQKWNREWLFNKISFFYNDAGVLWKCKY